MKSLYDIRRDNVRQLVEARFGGSQTRLAKAVGLAQPSFVSRLLTDRSGTRKNIGHRLARRIEAALKLSPNSLDSLDALGRRAVERPPLAVRASAHDEKFYRSLDEPLFTPEKALMFMEQRVPLLTAEELARFATLAAARAGLPAAPMVTAHSRWNQGHVVAFRLPDDAMDARFPADSIVVVTDERAPRSGDFVAGVLPGSTVACVRKWTAGSDWQLLVPINRAYEPVRVTLDFRLLGVVIEAIQFIL
jgi:hypothetical protein